MTRTEEKILSVVGLNQKGRTCQLFTTPAFVCGYKTTSHVACTIFDSTSTKISQSRCSRLCDCCRQAGAVVISNRSNKIHQPWCTNFSLPPQQTRIRRNFISQVCESTNTDQLLRSRRNEGEWNRGGGPRLYDTSV